MNASCAAHADVNELVAAEGVVAAGGKLGVAAILYTYRCTIACRHCCFGSCGHRPDVRMSTEQALGHLRRLHELGRVIHIAGGECMMYWDALSELLRAAPREAVQPHFIETTCSFASDDGIVRERLGELRDCGVAGILLSADPYHQAFVPPENFLRVRRAATEAFGAANVWCSDAPDEQIVAFAEIARDDARLREYVRAQPPMLVGTAWRELRRYLDEYPLAELPLDTGWKVRYQAKDCAIDFRRETIWELHVDPYDNIQTNCGVILGKACEVGLADVMARGPENANPLTSLLAREGPFGLVDLAASKHGYVPPATACSKCDLCFAVRRFLRPFYPDILGPAEVYGE